MNFKGYKSVVAVCLVAAIMFVPINVSIIAQDNPASTAAGNQQDAAVIQNKSEVIYANLTADGKVRSAYAVNHFELAQAGTVKDYGRYVSVVNVTSTEPLIHEEEAVSFGVDADNFYYQGNMATVDLPWNFEIAYYLNGEKTQPEDLAGASGELEVAIATSQNDKIDPTFYEHYMLQISLTLDTDKCSNIDAPDAATARAGKGLVIVHTVLPNRDGDFRITASVKDFSMEGIEIAALPFAMMIDLPETSEMVDNFKTLSAAISAFHDGIGQLTLGASDFSDGAGELVDGSAGFRQGLARVSSQSEQLTGASAQINDVLEQFALFPGDDLPSELNPDDLNQVMQGLKQLALGLKEAAGGLRELEDGFALAYNALDAAMKEIPDAPLTQEQIETLYTHTPPDQHTMLDRLVESYIAGQTTVGTYHQVKGAFDAIAPTMKSLSLSIDTLAGMLDGIAENLSALSGMDMIGQIDLLFAGLSELAANYTDFHNGLTAYMDGVNELAANYDGIHAGVAAFHDGAKDLHGGAVKLHNGTKLLNNETTALPERLQAEIDELLGQYNAEDFDPISFTSLQNEHTGFVQFVIKSDAIEKPEESEDITLAPDEESFWDRLLALFKRN